MQYKPMSNAAIRCAALIAFGTVTLLPQLAAAQPAPAPSASPALGIPLPANIINSPYVQGVLNALGGITQTTTGPMAFGKVTYFKRFDLQLQTGPTVYRQVHLHQGTIINPRGSTITAGTVVQVSGAAQPDGSLNADSINLR